MRIKIDNKENCCGCYSCYNACPINCIEMINDNKGFWYPTVNEKICLNYGLCEKSCPILHRNVCENNVKKETYACFNNNEKTRIKSSSGGIFTTIAENVIEKGGLVFGAAFDNNFNVFHKFISEKSDLRLLRGSKYVQSRILNGYRQVEEYLIMEKTVLFSGTPCQIAGLKSYLNKEYVNLVTIDFICHGVPSVIVWQKYLCYVKRKFNYLIKNVSFRGKRLEKLLYEHII